MMLVCADSVMCSKNPITESAEFSNTGWSYLIVSFVPRQAACPSKWRLRGEIAFPPVDRSFDFFRGVRVVTEL